MNSNYNKNSIIINKFLCYLKNSLEYSEKTIKAYNLDLLQFCTFIKEYLNLAINIKEFNIFTFLQVKESDIIAFLVYLNFNRDNSPYTRQRKLCTIRRFYKWLLSSTNPKIQKDNPTKYISNIKKVIKIPKYLTLEQSKKIQEIFTLENTKFSVRNNAIISLFLSSGMRVGELISINLIDINFTNNSIRIKGKGNKERVVYFSNNCKNKLLKYISERNRNKKFVNLEDPLFISYQNKRLGIDGVEDVCSKAYKLMGLDNYGYTTHTLRHTAATLMYRYVSQDIILLKKFLGHSQLSSTEIYSHVYNKQVKEAVNKNPLNEFSRKKVA